jgi:hypothetical protein
MFKRGDLVQWFDNDGTLGNAYPNFIIVVTEDEVKGTSGFTGKIIRFDTICLDYTEIHSSWNKSFFRPLPNDIRLTSKEKQEASKALGIRENLYDED